jgi:hypothetical protein
VSLEHGDIDATPREQQARKVTRVIIARGVLLAALPLAVIWLLRDEQIEPPCAVLQHRRLEVDNRTRRSRDVSSDDVFHPSRRSVHLPRAAGPVTRGDAPVQRDANELPHVYRPVVRAAVGVRGIAAIEVAAR